MKLEKIAAWLDKTLKVADFDDVSNNGLQVEREEGRGKSEEVRVVAFAVDASVKNVKAAAKAGAQLLVVHHGISWGGGIKRISGGVYNVVKAAMDANLAVYACHLPLDAHPVLGNNAQLAKLLKLKNVKQAFSYHGNVIGVVGEGLKVRVFESLKVLGLQNSHTFKLSNLQTLKPSNFQTFKLSNLQTFKLSNSQPLRVGVCSGGAGEFAEEAKALGCDLYVTGEASWGDVIAAENVGMKMVCAGHYETEVFGVRAVAKAMAKALRVKTVDLELGRSTPLARS